MATATSEDDCVNRHIYYQFDIENELDHLQEKRLRRMFQLVPNGATVLDVGCNSGYADRYLPTCDIYGVDVAQNLLTRAGSRIKATCARAEALPFPDCLFDVVILGEILEHVFSPTAVLREAKRVATRAIVGSVPNEYGNWGKHAVDGHPHHVRAYTRKELYAVLSMFGPTTIAEIVGNFFVFEVRL